MINGKSASRFKIPAKSMAIYNLEEISKWLKNQLEIHPQLHTGTILNF